VAFITCRTQLLRLPNQGPAPISAEFWRSGADDGKFQIACGLRLIVLTEQHDGADRCAQLCQLLPGLWP
jgi:hypothetical protein